MSVASGLPYLVLQLPDDADSLCDILGGNVPVVIGQCAPCWWMLSSMVAKGCEPLPPVIASADASSTRWIVLCLAIAVAPVVQFVAVFRDLVNRLCADGGNAGGDGAENNQSECEPIAARPQHHGGGRENRQQPVDIRLNTVQVTV